MYLVKKYQSVFLSGFLLHRWSFLELSNSNRQINKFFYRSKKIFFKRSFDDKNARHFFRDQLSHWRFLMKLTPHSLFCWQKVITVVTKWQCMRLRKLWRKCFSIKKDQIVGHHNTTDFNVFWQYHWVMTHKIRIIRYDSWTLKCLNGPVTNWGCGMVNSSWSALHTGHPCYWTWHNFFYSF